VHVRAVPKRAARAKARKIGALSPALGMPRLPF
jgi:hypothetical protein